MFVEPLGLFLRDFWEAWELLRFRGFTYKTINKSVKSAYCFFYLMILDARSGDTSTASLDFKNVSFYMEHFGQRGISKPLLAEVFLYFNNQII